MLSFGNAEKSEKWRSLRLLVISSPPDSVSFSVKDDGVLLRLVADTLRTLVVGLITILSPNIGGEGLQEPVDCDVVTIELSASRRALGPDFVPEAVSNWSLEGEISSGNFLKVSPISAGAPWYTCKLIDTEPLVADGAGQSWLQEAKSSSGELIFSCTVVFDETKLLLYAFEISLCSMRQYVFSDFWERSGESNDGSYEPQ
jgi:hypothetical protein